MLLALLSSVFFIVLKIYIDFVTKTLFYRFVKSLKSEFLFSVVQKFLSISTESKIVATTWDLEHKW